ncbi:hypothetical protein F1880_005712 [Penicillium rolfsii]|nr:hypothetical protein F1880_005712 [Penicillium rolfsii]
MPNLNSSDHFPSRDDYDRLIWPQGLIGRIAPSGSGARDELLDSDLPCDLDSILGDKKTWPSTKPTTMVN